MTLIKRLEVLLARQIIISSLCALEAMKNIRSMYISGVTLLDSFVSGELVLNLYGSIFGPHLDYTQKTYQLSKICKKKG